MRLNLRTYLFVCLGVIAVLPGLLLGAVLTQRSEAQQMTQADEGAYLAAEALARETAQLMGAHTDATQGLSRQVEAAGTLDPAILQGIVTAQHRAADTLGNMWVANSALRSLAVDPPLDAQGKPAAGVDYSDRDYAQKVSTTNATAYSRAQLGRTTRRPNLQIAEPIRDADGRFIGFSQAAVELSEIQALVEQILARSPGLHAIVLDSEGRVLAHPDLEARQSMRDLSHVPLYASARLSAEGQIRTGPDENGTEMRAAVAAVPMDGLDWTVLITRTQAEVAANAAQARQHTLITAGSALIAGLLLAAALAALLARPIARLAAVAVQVGRGDFTGLPPSPHGWLPLEVGTLLLSFRDMVVQLRARTEELAQRVDERTAELVVANQELDASLKQLREARDAAEETQQRFRSLFEHNTDAVFSFDLEGCFTSANAACERMSGYAIAELQGSSFGRLMIPEHRAGALEQVRRATVGEPRTTELTIIRKDGDLVDLQVNTVPIIVGGAIVGVFGLGKDVTARKRAEQALEHQALHDALTGLPNRTLLHDRLQQAIEVALREHAGVSLLLLDLDRFKEVNDSLGHQAGDDLLREVAGRLRETLRRSDTVARLGGDEFAIVLPKTDSDGAVYVAQALLRALERPMMLEGLTLTVGGSVGIAAGLAHGQDAATLLRCADVAMYVAKRAHSGYAVYAPDLDEHRADELALAGELQRAIEQDELTLHYQPKVNLRTRRLERVEALVRWQHPEQGLLPPNRFIGMAEKSGLIDSLSHWVLRNALEQCSRWRKAGLDLPVSVNLSVQNLHDPQLPTTIATLLEAGGLPAEALVVELTESGLIVHAQQIIDVLTALRALGIQVAIDDFGAGNASLGYLKQLPVDQLKIDKSFVKDMRLNERDAALVRSTIDLAHNLGLGVVAEGVEDWETLELLTKLGCDLAQGYYLARPLSPASLMQWLQTSPWGWQPETLAA